jgi:arachidonate 5-lipoxygenase
VKALIDRVVLTVTCALIAAWVAWKSFRSRLRMSHKKGILAAGRIRIVERPQFPEHDFFRPGAEFPCRLRHASISYLDDAMLVVRAASLKFADNRDESPLDLLLNTGQTSFFWDVQSFKGFGSVTNAGRDPHFVKWMEDWPSTRKSLLESVRRNPETFAQLYYYSQTSFEFHARDGRPRFVKFRLIPGDRGKETGLPDWGAEPWNTGWTQAILPGETRDRNYLKDEYQLRVARGPVTYHLQLQLHEQQPGDTRDYLLSCMVVWDEATHPWMDLATVTIDRTLPYEEEEWSLFSIGHHPPSIGITPATSTTDPASLNYLRLWGTWAARARLLSMRLRGIPPPIPDQRTPGFYNPV